jgi:hypothetical protein
MMSRLDARIVLFRLFNGNNHRFFVITPYACIFCDASPLHEGAGKSKIGFPSTVAS